MADATDWFKAQTQLKNASPNIRFFMAGSDHGPRVIKWPKVKTDVEKITMANASITLANADGLYNGLYRDVYTMNNSCTLTIGFTHPESGDEEYDVFTGRIKQVEFDGADKVKVTVFDKFYDISKIKIGNTDVPASYSAQIPSDIAWDLCTTHGGLSSGETSANPDLHFTSFERWAASFSVDNVTAEAFFTGEKLSEALATIARQTDSFIFVDGEGKIVFERFSENGSLDFLLNEGQYNKLKISVDGLSVINKQYVSFNYSPTSDYWENQVFAVNTTSVNSFGLQEDVAESELFWYVSSVDAITQANRKISRWGSPPRKFEIGVPLFGLHRYPTDTIRFVNSHFGVTSDQGWRIASREVNLDPKKIGIVFKTNEGYVANAFYLDVHDLDGDEQLL